MPNFSFTDYNIGSCYWAGFLMADGYVKKNKSGQSLRLKLAAYDIDHLRRFLLFLDISNHIYHEVDKKLDCHKAYVEIADQQMISDLADRFGIVRNKTKTAEFPHIPESFVSHFLRGLWDGDGGWHYDKQKKRTRPYITVKSAQLIYGIQLRLDLALGFSFSISHNNTTPSLRLYSKPKIQKFREWLYFTAIP